ncbi:MAG: N-glycosylase/DNA lyase [Pyrobaculum sp.]
MESKPLKRVVDTIKSFGIEYIFRLEKKDPQYRAVCNIVNRHGEVLGARLVLYNALISYRLLGKGEEHWEYFSTYFSKNIYDICRDFIKYIEESPYLKLRVEARKRRILKICNYTPDIEDVESTLVKLSKLLNASPDQKTLTFAIKILNYVYMCSRGVDRMLPFTIPIPVDYRVAYLTWCSGLTDLLPHEGVKKHREIQSIWNEVARLTNIPPLHIDTILWLGGRAVLYGENIHGVSNKIIEIFRWREECRTPLRRSQATSEV